MNLKTISLCLNYSSERGYYYSAEPPKDDFGQVDYCKFMRRELFDLPKGISLNIEDGMPYFYDNKTEMCIPSIPSDDPYDDFTTVQFQHRKESV